MRLSEDPVLMYHRPLMWYLLVGFLDLLVHIKLRQLGFFHHKAATSHHRPIFPPSLSHFSSDSGSNLSYWYKPPRTHSPILPIVFSHGIGVGLHSYLPLLSTLATLNPDVPIYCIENHHVSMRIVAEVPRKDDVCCGVLTMLQQYNHKKAVFVGHSIGTITLSYLLHHPSTRAYIAGLVFLDPINFLLYLPDVAYNFLYRTPTRANEWMLHAIVAREAGISWTLWRRFFWFEGVVWKDEIDTSTINLQSEPWRGIFLSPCYI